MKNVKKLAGLVLAMILAFAMTVTAFAAEGNTGSITINGATNVPVAGKTFRAYKILDVTIVEGKEGEDTGYAYTVPEGMKKFYADKFGIAADAKDFDTQVTAKISDMKGKETELFAFAAEALKAAKDNGVFSKDATAGEGAESVTISDLPLGYYVVEDEGTATPISALLLNTTAPNMTATIKADQPKVDKKIDGGKDEDAGTTGFVTDNNASIGDNVPYRVTSNVPDMTGYTKYYFVLNDTMSKGLTFNNDVAITIGTKKLTKDTDYTVAFTENADGTTSVEIVFKDFIQHKALKGQDILVTYSATVNEKAEIGTTANKNTVTLVYSNNPNKTDNGTPENPDKPTPESPIGETPESKTHTFVTGLKIIKVDPNGKRLTGAEFEITGTKVKTVLVTKEEFEADEAGEYWKLKDGTYTKTAPVIADDETSTEDKYESVDTMYAKVTKKTPVHTTEAVKATGIVDENGELSFEGLGAGTYEITELKAPDGYNKLDQALQVIISFTAPGENSETCTWSVTGANTKITEDGKVELTVENHAGSLLPSTGGMGTTIFYIAGFLLAAGAAILLITRKRVHMEE